MIQKVALHSPSKEFCPEVIDFQAGRYVLSEELVVRFYFLIRCFYKDFSMFVPEAHKRLGSTDDFRHRQTAIIQCFTHLKEDYNIDNVIEYSEFCSFLYQEVSVCGLGGRPRYPWSISWMCMLDGILQENQKRYLSLRVKYDLRPHWGLILFLTSLKFSDISRRG